LAMVVSMSNGRTTVPSSRLFPGSVAHTSSDTR
jgi:hypothetical protein